MPDRPPSRRIRVVVTGLGAVSAYGWSFDALWNGARSGRTAIGPFDRFDSTSHRTHLAAQVPAPPEGAPKVSTGAAGRRLSLADLFALASTDEALRQAGLDPPSPDVEVGVYFGSSTGGMWEGERFFERYARTGGRRFLHRLLESQQYNGPGDAVARHVGATGPVETVSSACASSSMAIGLAVQALRRGEVDVAVAGGSDSLCEITYGGFNALRSVDPEASRPFRTERAGLSLGEGAAVLVLESAEHAAARGARALAEVRGAAATCDAHHMTAPEPGGMGAAAALRAALEDAGLDPEALDFVNAHGTGTPLNDAAEAKALHAVLGSKAARLPVTSTKALVGHLLGSAGCIEAAITVRCLVEREVHPMPAGGEADPSCDLDLVLGEPRALERCEHAASINLAFGGANAALVFSRVP